MVEKPFGTDLDERPGAQRHHARGVPRGRRLPGRPLARAGPARERAVRPVRELDLRAAAQPDPRGERPDHDGRGVRRLGPRQLLRPHRRHPGRRAEPHAAGARQRPRRAAVRAGADSWLAAKSSVIGALRPLDAEHTVRGQYDGYLDVAGVAPGSTTESYVAVRLAVDSWRWADVPIVIRAGKCMPVTATEVLPVPAATGRIFGPAHRRPATGCGSGSGRRARSGSRWWARSRVPAGSPQVRGPVVRAARGGRHAPLRPADRRRAGRHRWLFARQETVEAAWRVVDPVLGDATPVHPYAGAAGGRRRRTRCCRTATPGTTRSADHGSGAHAMDTRRDRGRDRRRRLRRAVRRPGAASGPRRRDPGRPRRAPPLPAAALPVRDRHPVRGADRGAAAGPAQAAPQRRRACSRRWRTSTSPGAG